MFVRGVARMPGVRVVAVWGVWGVWGVLHAMGVCRVLQLLGVWRVLPVPDRVPVSCVARGQRDRSGRRGPHLEARHRDHAQVGERDEQRDGAQRHRPA
ncbi:MAG: hypothetical protein ACQGVK_04115 [Myxococcota bacterium]